MDFHKCLARNRLWDKRHCNRLQLIKTEWRSACTAHPYYASDFHKWQHFEHFHMSGDIFCSCWKRFVLQRSVWHWGNNIVTAQRTDPNTMAVLSLPIWLGFSIAFSPSGTWVYVKPLNTSPNKSIRSPPLIVLHSKCIYSSLCSRPQPASVKLINAFP